MAYAESIAGLQLAFARQTSFAARSFSCREPLSSVPTILKIAHTPGKADRVILQRVARCKQDTLWHVEALDLALVTCCSLPQLVRNACSAAPVALPLSFASMSFVEEALPLHMSGGRRGRGGGEVRRITHHHGGGLKARRCHHLKQPSG